MPDTLDRKALSIAGSVVFSNASDDASWGVQDGAFASVEQQAGIYAGEGGFAIDVAGNTDLVGGVIASEADPASNTLSTGTLTASDIENYEEWSASQTSLSASLGSGAGRDEDGNQSAASRANASLPGLSTPLGQLTAGAPVSLGDDGAQDGITRSAIAPGTITITSGDAASEQLAATITRDTGSANTGALTQEFTDTQRDEIANGFAAGSLLTQEVATFLANRAEEQAEAEAEAERLQAALDGGYSPYELGPDGQPVPLSAQAAFDLEREIAKLEADADTLDAVWGGGGAGNIALTALRGAASGDVTGNLAGLAQATAVNVLQSLATSEVKAIADSLMSGGRETAASETTRAALQALTGCAGAIGSGQGDCGGAAMGAAASVVVNNLLNAIDAPEDEDLNGDGDFADPGERASLEEQQARTNLVATIVGGIAEAAGLDTPSATLAAAIETQNNELVLPDGSLTQIGSRPAYLSISQLREKDASFNAAINRAAEMAGIDAGTLEKAYIAYVECKGAPADVCNTPAIEFFDAIAALYDATDKYWQEKDEFLDANCGQGLVLTCGINSTDSFLESPDGIRFKGAFDTVLGGAGVVLGGVTTITSGIACPASGVGCLATPVAAAGTAASADQAYTGYQMLITGEPQNTLGAQWLAENTHLSLEEAEQAYAIATIFVSIGEVGALTRLSRANKATGIDNLEFPFTRVGDGPLPTGRQSLDPTEISFSQATISGRTSDGMEFNELVDSMRRDGWQGDPVDVVNMPDGAPTSIDNRRLLAAREAGIPIEANVHNASDPLTASEVRRFRVNGEPEPTTWGEAIRLRIQRQRRFREPWPDRFPNGSIFDPERPRGR